MQIMKHYKRKPKWLIVADLIFDIVLVIHTKRRKKKQDNQAKWEVYEIQD